MRADPEADREPGGFAAWFIRNSIAANLLMFAIVVAGLLTLGGGYSRTEVFPEIKPNVVTVQAFYRGATPEEVEQGVCQRIEEAIAGVTGIDKITATASEGSGMVVAETLADADLEQVYSDIKNRVDAITTFPDEVERPIVSRLVVRKEIVNVAIYGDVDERTLKRTGERARDQLAALPGISQVELSSVRPYEISIEVSEEALRRFRMTFDEVASAVRRSSLDLPAGSIKAASGQTLLRAKGQAYDRSDFEKLVLRTDQNGARITLGQVARIVDGFEDVDLISRFDGKPAVLLKVFRVGDQDALKITDQVHQWVAGQGKNLLPTDAMRMTTWRDESVILKGRIDLLLRNAAQGGVIVLLLLSLFLQLRLALWVALGIPISFLGALALVPSLDISLNMISLFAFLLVLGIVVDDAIVVGENIFLHRKKTRSPLAAALRGSREVRVPVLASVLTTMAAFLPMLFFVPGADAQIWRVIPLIVIPVLLFSLIESQLVLPAHLAHLSIPAEERRPWIGARVLGAVQSAFQGAMLWFVDRVYRPTVGFCLRWRYLTLASASALLLLMAGLAASGHPRFIFFPQVDGDNVVVSLTMPQGTPVETTSALIRRIERAAEDARDEFDALHPGRPSVVQHMLATVGSRPYATEQARNGGQRDAQFDSGSHLGELNIQLAPSEDREIASDAFMSRVREKVGVIPDAVELTFTTSLFSTGKDVDVELKHRDMDVLRAAAKDLELELRRRPDVKDVTDSFRLGKRELELRIKERAEILGLSQADLARQVRQAFYGEEAQRIQRGRDDVKVMVRYPASGRRSVADLENMRIRTPDGEAVPFGEVAEVLPGRAYSTITRVDRERVVRVSGEIDESDPSASPEAVNRELRESVLPALVAKYDGLSWSFEGDQKKKMDLLQSLAVGFCFSLFLIYALMAIPLRSYLQPFIIMTAIPFGIGGAILGHIIMGYDLSILSMFGAVALAGVVVNDNIVLVDWINHRQQEHDSLVEAVSSAGAARFRPIMLTSLTTFGGLTPLLLERSLQARFLVPMAVSLGFGVLFATAVSLVLAPSVYLVLDDLKRAVGALLRWLYGGREDATAEDMAPSAVRSPAAPQRS
ncbi:MAG: efflux RND transporter permease subunit [Planctomycetota bacterium]